MNKINGFKITCKKCNSIVTLNINSDYLQITDSKLNIVGVCTICREALGFQILKISELIQKYNECCDELNEMSNVEIIFNTCKI
jgi:transcription elongation factor Elf1